MSWANAQLLQLCVGLVLSLILCRGVIALKINDLPDGGRKRQAAAVPSAGGLAIAGAAMIGWVVALEARGSPSPGFDTYVLVVAMLSALVIGLLDDMGFLKTSIKFALLAALAIGVASQLYVQHPYWIAELGEPPLLNSMPPIEDNFSVYKLVLIAGSALWIFVVMNASNFMDGSNGMLAGCKAIMLSGVAVLFLAMVGSNGFTQLPFVAIGGALCGFLFWNLRGQLYAGDAGSLMLGAFFAASGLIIVREGNVSVFTIATFALPFLVDVVLTVIWRARRGHNVLTAHREHAYQLFLRAGWSHWKVAILWWAGTFACVAVGIAAFMMRGPFPAIAFVAGALLGVLAWQAQRKYFTSRLGL